MKSGIDPAAFVEFSLQALRNDAGQEICRSLIAGLSNFAASFLAIFNGHAALRGIYRIAIK